MSQSLADKITAFVQAYGDLMTNLNERVTGQLDEHARQHLHIRMHLADVAMSEIVGHMFLGGDEAVKALKSKIMEQIKAADAINIVNLGKSQ